MADSGREASTKYAYLEQLSTERLKELLTMNSDVSSDDEDEAYIDAIMEVILKREEEEPTGFFPDVDTAWEEFQTHYNVPEGDGLSLYQEEDNCISEARNTIPFKARHRLRRVIAVAAVIACLVVFLLPAAMGYGSFFEMVGAWTDTIFQFQPSGSVYGDGPTNNAHPSPSHSQVEYDSLQQALDSYGITENIAPTWLPEGYTLDYIDVWEYPESDDIDFVAYYVNGSKSLSILVTYHKNGANRAYEKDPSVVETYRVENINHYIFRNNGRLTAAWFVSPFEVSISADISLSTMHQILNSVY